MKNAVTALFAVIGFALAGSPAFAAEKAIEKAPATSPAPLLTPEALEKIKAHLAELHTARIKILTEGRTCVEAAKSAEAVQLCIEQEQAAVNGGKEQGTPAKGVKAK